MLSMLPACLYFMLDNNDGFNTGADNPKKIGKSASKSKKAVRGSDCNNYEKEKTLPGIKSDPENSRNRSKVDYMTGECIEAESKIPKSEQASRKSYISEGTGLYKSVSKSATTFSSRSLKSDSASKKYRRKGAHRKISQMNFLTSEHLTNLPLYDTRKTFEVSESEQSSDCSFEDYRLGGLTHSTSLIHSFEECQECNGKLVNTVLSQGNLKLLKSIKSKEKKLQETRRQLNEERTFYEMQKMDLCKTMCKKHSKSQVVQTDQSACQLMNLGWREVHGKLTQHKLDCENLENITGVSKTVYDKAVRKNACLSKSNSALQKELKKIYLHLGYSYSSHDVKRCMSENTGSCPLSLQMRSKEMVKSLKSKKRKKLNMIDRERSNYLVLEGSGEKLIISGSLISVHVKGEKNNLRPVFLVLDDKNASSNQCIVGENIESKEVVKLPKQIITYKTKNELPAPSSEELQPLNSNVLSKKDLKELHESLRQIENEILILPKHDGENIKDYSENFSRNSFCENLKITKNYQIKDRYKSKPEGAENESTKNKLKKKDGNEIKKIKLKIDRKLRPESARSKKKKYCNYIQRSSSDHKMSVIENLSTKILENEQNCIRSLERSSLIDSKQLGHQSKTEKKYKIKKKSRKARTESEPRNSNAKFNPSMRSESENRKASSENEKSNLNNKLKMSSSEMKQDCLKDELNKLKQLIDTSDMNNVIECGTHSSSVQ